MVTTLPANMARCLSLSSSQELESIDDGVGDVRLVPNTLERAGPLPVNEKIISEYNVVFRAVGNSAA